MDCNIDCTLQTVFDRPSDIRSLAKSYVGEEMLELLKRVVLSQGRYGALGLGFTHRQSFHIHVLGHLSTT